MNRMQAGNIGADDFVSVADGDAVSSSAEPGTAPLEAVIGMAKAVRRHVEEQVDFGIRGRDHDRGWPHRPEDRPLQNGEPLGIAQSGPNSAML
jgi:hypothetical protein